MIRVCSWCGDSLGEKEPFDYSDVTHGICKSCLLTELSHLLRTPAGRLEISETFNGEILCLMK